MGDRRLRRRAWTTGDERRTTLTVQWQTLRRPSPRRRRPSSVPCRPLDASPIAHQLCAPIQAPRVLRIVTLADRDDDVHVGAANQVVLMVCASREYRLRAAAVLPHESPEIAEAVTGHVEPERALAEHQ